MTYEEFLDGVEKLLPHADIQRDNYGQIVIYTGLTVGNADGELVEFDPNADDD